MPFSMIGRCFLVLPVSIFSVKITALGSLKRVPGRIFKVQRSKLNLEFDFIIN
jgi:hypothetical protein